MLTFIAGVALAGAPAHADTPEPLMPPAPPPSAPHVESYRGVIIAVDAAAVGLVVVGIATAQPIGPALGLSMYLIGAPVAHLSMKRRGRALASLSLRVAGPMLGVLVGDTLPRSCTDCAPPPEIFYGMFGGVVVASALDALLLAKGDPEPPSASWRPVAAPTQDGFALGIAGSF